MPIALKSGSLNFLELSGPAQACKGIALPLTPERPINLLAPELFFKILAHPVYKM